MDQDHFIAILRRYLRGDATPSEKELIESWYSSIGRVVPDEDFPGDTEMEKYYRKYIHSHIKKSTFKENIRKFFPWYATGIAASLLLVTFFSFFFYITNGVTKKTTIGEKEMVVAGNNIVNTTQLQHIINLPDSSKVTLGPGSELKISRAFNTTNREVYLEGEAAFEVTHNTSLPFLVFANEVTTKVLGTSFVIRAIKHEQRITVVVKTGKVSVYTNTDSKKTSTSANAIILTPNQQVVYDKYQHEISKTLVEKPRVILTQDEVKRMRFEEAPVTEIFKALEKAYGVDIEFDEKIFSSCELTTVISDDDIYSRLDIICDALGTSYVREHDRIVISSSGCKAR